MKHSMGIRVQTIKIAGLGVSWARWWDGLASSVVRENPCLQPASSHPYESESVSVNETSVAVRYRMLAPEELSSSFDVSAHSSCFQVVELL